MTFLELLAASIILAFVSAAALTGWAISVRAPSSQRSTEMGAFIATQEMERLRAAKYLGNLDTSQNSPNVAYYDKWGSYQGKFGTFQPTTSTGYQAKSWVRVLVDRDGIANTEDVKELEVQVWDRAGTTLLETERSMLTFGGI